MANKDNPGTGRNFEKLAKVYLKRSENLDLNSKVSLEISANKNAAKPHFFDLGSNENKVIVECKCHSWTKNRNVPSAKMAVWNEAMYYFILAPDCYRKILFVKRIYCEKRKETLAEYYTRIYSHLVPYGVEILEYDLDTDKCFQVFPYKEK